MPDLFLCAWCGSTPPRHDRCEVTGLRLGPKVGMSLDTVGASVPVYERIPTPCGCHCRTDGVQGGLFPTPRQEGPPF